VREIIDSLGHVPKACTWELTLRCNLNCGHCGSRAGEARAGEMGRDRVLAVARELAALGCTKVTLSGGEPTLSPHWEAVASEGARAGMRVNMITNGVVAGRDLVRRAKDAGLVSLGVSLDGLEQAHDRIRGLRGLYGRVMRLLDDCTAERMPVGVVTTIWKGNLRDLEALHDLIAGRVYVWQLQIGAAMGNLADRRCEQIAPEDLLDVIPAIAALVRRCKVAVHVADNVGYFGPYEETLRRRRTTPVPCWVGCYAGCRNVGIEADGGVKGCLSIQATRATEGNLQAEPLDRIWRRKGAFAYNREFSLDDLGGFCRTCEHAAICRGGCLSMRTCEGGRENPFCYHRVATLAERRARRGRPKGVPLAIAPAAILALFGIGCGGETVQESAVTAPGGGYAGQGGAGSDGGAGDAARSDADAAQPDTSADNIAPKYGLPEPEPDAGPDMVTYYGMPDTGPQDAGPDLVTFYGLPDTGPQPDVVPEATPKYALPEPAPEAGPEGGSWYGFPAPDAEAG
jgi:radical SAM protein with 4Fe4S-binding SPASM domain